MMEQNGPQDEILMEFKKESKLLVDQLGEILSEVEQDFGLVKKLEDYGQAVDRIMGGAKSIALNYPPEHFIHQVGDYSALCKAVGYKASQIEDNEDFFRIAVAVLLDATEALEKMINSIGTGQNKPVSELLSKTFLNRLSWVSNQFGEGVRSTVATKAQGAKLSQNEIDDLMKKLGIG